MGRGWWSLLGLTRPSAETVTSPPSGQITHTSALPGTGLARQTCRLRRGGAPPCWPVAIHIVHVRILRVPPLALICSYVKHGIAVVIAIQKRGGSRNAGCTAVTRYLIRGGRALIDFSTLLLFAQVLVERIIRPRCLSAPSASNSQIENV